VLTPAESSRLAPILPFFNSKVIGICIRKTEQLKVEFRDGQILEVDPRDLCEAWELGCSTIGLLLVCSPGARCPSFGRPTVQAKAQSRSGEVMHSIGPS
jgi:hypothetical protein